MKLLSGNIAIGWTCYPTGVEDGRICGKILSPEGRAVKSFSLNAGRISTYGSIAALADGGFVVTLTKQSKDGRSAAYTQRYSPDKLASAMHSISGRGKGRAADSKASLAKQLSAPRHRSPKEGQQLDR